MFSDALMARVLSGKCIAIFVFYWWCAGLPFASSQMCFHAWCGSMRMSWILSRHQHTRMLWHAIAHVQCDDWGVWDQLAWSLKFQWVSGGRIWLHVRLVVLFEEGGKCGATHLKLFFAMAFVMGGSEGPHLQNDPFDSCRSPCLELSGTAGVHCTPCKYVCLTKFWAS